MNVLGRNSIIISRNPFNITFALNVIDNVIGVEELLTTVPAMACILPSSREQ